MTHTSLTKYNTQWDQRKYSKYLASVFKNDHHKGVYGLFVYPNIVRNRFNGLALSLLTGLLLVGCGGDQPRGKADTKKYTDQSSAVFAPDAAQSGAQASGSGEVNGDIGIGGWSIMLVQVGQGGMERAKEMLRIIKEDAGLEGAFIDRRSKGLVIAYGDYLDKSDPKVIKDLERVRSIDLMGVKLFDRAIVMPPTSESLRGSNQLYDLRSVKARYGDRAVYTLQIGIYGRSDYQMSDSEDLLAFRRTAEEAVRALRADGVMAFYYHAPARSMVTVGIFGEKDFDSTTRPPSQSLLLRKMREKFPHNLLNGQGINETTRTESGKVTRLQSSQLVGIPEK